MRLIATVGLNAEWVWVSENENLATHLTDQGMRITSTEENLEASMQVVDDMLETKVSRADYDAQVIAFDNSIAGLPTQEDYRTLANIQASTQLSVDQWSAVITAIREQTGEQEVTLSQITQYMQFDENFLTIGKSDSSLYTRITNERLSFMDGGTEVAYIEGKTMYINSMTVVERAVIGNHIHERVANGGTVIRYVGAA